MILFFAAHSNHPQKITVFVECLFTYSSRKEMKCNSGKIICAAFTTPKRFHFKSPYETWLWDLLHNNPSNNCEFPLLMFSMRTIISRHGIVLIEAFHCANTFHANLFRLPWISIVYGCWKHQRSFLLHMLISTYMIDISKTSCKQSFSISFHFCFFASTLNAFAD